MEELKKIGRVLGRAAANLLGNLTNYRGWGFLAEALLGIILLPAIPEDPNVALALMLGAVCLFSLLETGITPKYRKGEEWYKLWYTIKGTVASFGLVWIALGEKLPAEGIIVAVVAFDLVFAAIYGKRLAVYAWRPRIPTWKPRVPSVPGFKRPALFHREIEVGEEPTGFPEQ